VHVRVDEARQHAGAGEVDAPRARRRVRGVVEHGGDPLSREHESSAERALGVERAHAPAHEDAGLSRHRPERIRSPAMPPSRVCLTFDFDALSVWFGYDRVTPAMLQRGEYGARVGVPRLLERLGALGLPATFFIPGHTIESFPAECEAILAAGHEVAHHSYAHVDPSLQAPAEERADMERALAALDRLGVRPSGYRSPSADMSPATLPLLEEHGFLYDSSMMADDFRPYRPRIGDRVTREQPLQRGREARLWELPMCFELDDWPHFQFAFGPPYRAGLSAPSKVLEIWTEEFDWMHRHVDGGLLTVCMHPQVIARGHRMAMLERFVEHCSGAGARFARMGDVARQLG
jgi:peptidoglycan-N-acetylglucosamine deacetylase